LLIPVNPTQHASCRSRRGPDRYNSDSGDLTPVNCRIRSAAANLTHLGAFVLEVALMAAIGLGTE